MLADGAIRSGKTVSMILSFLLWSLSTFQDRDFIVAGVTGGALRRNVLSPMFRMLETYGVPYEWKRSEAKVVIGTNTYHLFGADKDNAQDKLQGMTAAGAYADEAALFPRSFVDQMIGRCSVTGSRIFMNCNPNGAYHYIKTDFIYRAAEIGLYRLHFTMDDNLTLSPGIRERFSAPQRPRPQDHATKSSHITPAPTLTFTSPSPAGSGSDIKHMDEWRTVPSKSLVKRRLLPPPMWYQGRGRSLLSSPAGKRECRSPAEEYSARQAAFTSIPKVFIALRLTLVLISISTKLIKLLYSHYCNDPKESKC